MMSDRTKHCNYYAWHCLLIKLVGPDAAMDESVLRVYSITAAGTRAADIAVDPQVFTFLCQ